LALDLEITVSETAVEIISETELLKPVGQVAMACTAECHFRIYPTSWQAGFPNKILDQTAMDSIVREMAGAGRLDQM
jgi:hypothetical protein